MADRRDWIELAENELAAMNKAELAAAGLLFPRDQFRPTVYYPPITEFPPADVDRLLAGDAAAFTADAYAAYVHIPFCQSRCAYCHWVFAVGADEAAVDDYLATVEKEMQLVKRRLGRERIPVSTALFGGGTPTYLTARQLVTILTAFHRHYDLNRCRQFSFEIEPSSVLGAEGRDKLRAMRDFGVNRLCLGAQTFNDDILRRLGRRHTAAQTRAAAALARELGFESVSLDLIYGLPGQSVADWIATMEQAMASEANAWHLLRLRIERYGDVQARIKERYRNGPDDFPNEEEIELMKMLGWVMSEAHGFGQYIGRMFGRRAHNVSEFSRDYLCRLSDVVGVGPSGWSNYHFTFTQNIGIEMPRYRQAVYDGKVPADRGMCRDIETEARRSFITPLKNERIDKNAFRRRLGFTVQNHFGAELARLRAFGLIDEDERALHLTRRGQFFGDQTIMQFYQRRYVPFPGLLHPLMPA